MKMLFLIFALLLNSKISLAATENKAVEVSFFGGLTGFDQSAYQAVKAAMASLLVEGVIDQFKTSYTGREGGSSFCVQLSPATKAGIEEITHLLDVIHPRDSSVYKYDVIEKCQ